jgi:hypothetical protein
MNRNSNLTYRILLVVQATSNRSVSQSIEQFFVRLKALRGQLAVDILEKLDEEGLLWVVRFRMRPEQIEEVWHDAEKYCRR